MPNTNFQTFHQMGQAINEVVRQATGRDAVQNIDMDHVTVAQNHYYEKMTLSASRVSFTDRVGNTPLEKCVVQIEPVQDLHGYSKPWPAGGGKNLLRPRGVYTSTGFGITYSFTGDGVITLNGTATQNNTQNISGGTEETNKLYLPAGTYIVSAETFGNSECFIGINVNSTSGAYTATSRGTPNTFTITDGDYVFPRIRIGANASLTNTVVHPMIRRLSVSDDTWGPYSNICPITGWTGVNIHVSPTTDAQDGTTYPITFPSEAGTVYGGTLDVLNGVLTVDRASILVRDAPITKSSTNFSTWRIKPLIEPTPVDDRNAVLVISSIYEGLSYNEASTSGDNYVFLADAGRISIKHTATAGLTVDEYKSQYGDVRFVYYIAAPLTYQLTPQQITTLLGTNTIWADTGNIEVTIKVLKELY